MHFEVLSFSKTGGGRGGRGGSGGGGRFAGRGRGDGGNQTNTRGLVRKSSLSRSQVLNSHGFVHAKDVTLDS